MKSITIIGMTAAGKSTMGKELSKILGYKFKDLDHEVESEHGMEIGELYKFHDMDTISGFFENIYEEIVKEENTIISTGGFFGTYYDFEKAQGADNILFLDVSEKLFLKRIYEAKKNPDSKENKNRRIVKEPKKSVIKKHYSDRHPKYVEKCSSRFILENDKPENVEKCINEIVNTYKMKTIEPKLS